MAASMDGGRVPRLLFFLVVFVKLSSYAYFRLQPVSSAEIENETFVVTPRISTLNGSIYTTKKFVLTVDGKVVMYLDNLISALTVLFGSYFVFNIVYAQLAHSTLEFIQRCFVDINPKRGSKAPKVKGSKTVVPAKLLKLTAELKNFKTL